MKKKILIAILFSALLITGGLVFIHMRNSQSIKPYRNSNKVIIWGTGFKYKYKLPIEKGLSYAEAILLLHPTKQYEHIYRVSGTHKNEVKPEDHITKDTKISIS